MLWICKIFVLALLWSSITLGSCTEENASINNSDELFTRSATPQQDDEGVTVSIGDIGTEESTLSISDYSELDNLWSESEIPDNSGSDRSGRHLDMNGVALSPEANEFNKRNLNSSSTESNLSRILWHDDERPEVVKCGVGNGENWMSTFSGDRVKHMTNFAEFPWSVIISNNDPLFLGGGTLIAPNIVITLASILKNYTADKLQVIAGEWNADTEDEMLLSQNRSVVSIVTHPKYDGATKYKIALIVLNISFSLQPNIRTVCLPTPAADIEGSTCLSTAWSPPDPTKQMKYQYQIQSIDVCKSRLPKHYKEMDPSVICAIPTDNDPVIADHMLNSGASLFCPMKSNPKRFTQMGVVIGTTDRGSKRTGLFVNLTELMPWILKELGQRNTGLKYFLP